MDSKEVPNSKLVPDLYECVGIKSIEAVASETGHNFRDTLCMKIFIPIAQLPKLPKQTVEIPKKMLRFSFIIHPRAFPY